MEKNIELTNLTNDLEKLLDKSIKKEVEYLKINNYSLVLNYDGKKFLYKGFIPSSKTISLNLQQYDMYNLIKNKNIINKGEVTHGTTLIHNVYYTH